MKVALIVCGQMRNIDMCVDTWKEYLFPYYDCDIFVATQDVNAIKGRIYIQPIVVNQYVFQPIKYDIEDKLTKIFADCGTSSLKKINIRRKMYEKSINEQGSDFILKNSLGWAENFHDMKIALEMAGPSYNLYIKIRPDITLCKPFYNIVKPDKNTIYVNDKRDNFVWDAVFAMDKNMAKSMSLFYDYYCAETHEGIKSCFDAWDCKLNAEDKLLNYINKYEANIVNMGEVGYPITWLVGDLKNRFNWINRSSNFTDSWKRILHTFADKHISCYFDICATNTIVNNIIPFDYTQVDIKYKPKVALLICGQLRDYKLCIQSILEQICLYYDYDIYVSTQDSISIKPRLGRGLFNQYMVNKISDTQEIKNYFNQLFGDHVKAFHIRETYDKLIADQQSDLTFNKIRAWTGQFEDIQIAIQLALDSNIQYEYFVKVRPDVIITKPFIIENKSNENSIYVAGRIQNTCPEVIYAMDRIAALHMLKWNEWYNSKIVTDTWQSSYNTEYKLYEFIRDNNMNIVSIKSDAYPLHWMISDIYNKDRKRRHKELSPKWSIAVEQYIENFRQVIFDLIKL